MLEENDLQMSTSWNAVDSYEELDPYLIQVQ